MKLGLLHRGKLYGGGKIPFANLIPHLPLPEKTLLARKSQILFAWES